MADLCPHACIAFHVVLFDISDETIWVGEYCQHSEYELLFYLNFGLYISLLFMLPLLLPQLRLHV